MLVVWKYDKFFPFSNIWNHISKFSEYSSDILWILCVCYFVLIYTFLGPIFFVRRVLSPLFLTFLNPCWVNDSDQLYRALGNYIWQLARPLRNTGIEIMCVGYFWIQGNSLLYTKTCSLCSCKRLQWDLSSCFNYKKLLHKRILLKTFFHTNVCAKHLYFVQFFFKCMKDRTNRLCLVV